MVSDGPAAHADAAPPTPVGTESAPLLIDGERPTLYVPTLSLVQLVNLSKKGGLPLLLDDRVVGNLDPRGQHQLSDLQRVTGEGMTDFVRCRAHLLLKARDALRPYEVYLDFPSRYVGVLLNSAEAIVRDTTPEARYSDTFRFAVAKPTWAGSFSFDRIWREAERIVREPQAFELSEGAWNVSPGVMFRAETLLHLNEAHLVRVEPDQVQVLPEWDDFADLWDYARECAMPFDTLFLDFEGPGGLAPVHIATVRLWDDGSPKSEANLRVHLKGAVVRRESGWAAPDGRETEGRGVLVVPYGEVQQGEKVWGGYHALGGMMFGALTHDAEIHETEMTSYPRDGSPGFRATVPSIPASLLTDGMSGVVTLPFTAAEFARHVGRAGMEANKQAIAWGGVVLSCAARVMAALSIMESEAVVVDDAPLEKRDRDRAAKRGWQIAQMVYVRPTRKGARKSEPTGEERNYSHRFWVSGHYKHFPVGTKMADTRPDLVRPCTRPGDAACGMGCRRIWTPPFIKGPDDKPLVMKSLVKRRHAEATA
jgi:hypothetical protein